MIISEEQYLEHYGTPRHSGRYPWGSGGDDDRSSQRNRSFLDEVAGLKSRGLSEAKIAEGMGMNTTQLRARKTIALNQQKQEKIAQAQRLKDKGYSYVAVGKRMGINESSVRALLAPGEKDKVDVLKATASMLKDHVEEKKYIDIGSGVENHIGVSETKLKTAVAMLQEQGYKVHYLKVEQLGTGKQTTVKVLTKANVPYSEVYRNRGSIRTVTSFSEDHGRSYIQPQPPLSIKSKRVGINYAEDGGGKADGVIFVRPGVKDVSLGKARYAQVRIMVDGTHYLKGMAVYKDDLPLGKDLVFNTNKSSTGNHKDAMKSIKDDPQNPFGATVRQITDKGKVTSVMNIVGSKEGMGEEGGWGTWSKNLSSQMLSKQDPKLAERQLRMTYERRSNELNEIVKLTNPAIKRKLLDTFADSVDSAAVQLKAAHLPGQASHVILPVEKMKPTEVFAPNYKNGQRVVLVRYPHGGPFEIPELTVNNRQPDARQLIGPHAPDAIGIHPQVAQRLSGADFDGDTVLVIPNDRGAIKTAPPLDGLKGFDPQHAFPAYPGMKPITPARKQQEMGNVTNLIADMTIRGANNEEKARAIRHSMVVIDSEKHNLDYKSSAQANGIAQLKAKYQGIPTGAKFPARAGASTLITKANSEFRVPERKPRSAAKGGPIDKATGKRVFEETGRTYVNRQGKTVVKTQSSRRLAETDDAHTLSSGTRIENVYADHSNRLKAMANQARKEAVALKPIAYSPSAKATYTKEVGSLQGKLNLALRNRPLERQAQLLANAEVSQKRQANPHMDPEEMKKIRSQALITARARTGAMRRDIVITNEEWNAIQAGAISNHMLTQIINKADLERLKELATPRTERSMTATKRARALDMLKSGYTQAEVAEALGISVTTLRSSLEKS